MASQNRQTDTYKNKVKNYIHAKWLITEERKALRKLKLHTETGKEFHKTLYLQIYMH